MRKDSSEKRKTKRTGVIISIATLLVVGIIIIVVYQVFISPFNAVVVGVNGTEFKMNYVLKRIRFTGMGVRDTMNAIADEEVVRQTAASIVAVAGEDIRQYGLELMAARTGRSDPDGLESFLKELAIESGFADAELEQFFYTDVLIDRMNQFLVDHMQTVDEQVRLTAIFSKTESELNSAIMRLADGEGFEDLAAELNISSELRAAKGDMGWFTRGLLEDSLAAAVFDGMEIGQISQPFLMDDQSYALFFVAEREDAREIDSEMRGSMESVAFERWLEEQKTQCVIVLVEIDPKTESWINWQLQSMRKRGT